MVTLAALAYVAPLKGDHSVHDQEAHMLAGLEGVLAVTSLATQGEWSVLWMGLTESGGNLAYIVRHETDDKLAVVVRGTVFGPTWEALAVDLRQDAEVSSLADFAGVEVSTGAATAFEALLDARLDVVGYPGSGGKLVDALELIIGTGTPTIYVTGHSLGGCAATMLAVHLQQTFPKCVFQVYTYAAPTAGVQSFASLFDETFGSGTPAANSSWRVVNAWDVVPHAWSSLDTVWNDDWYPGPGPQRTLEADAGLGLAIHLPLWHVYVQPATNLVRLNGESAYGTPPMLWDKCNVTATNTTAECKGKISDDRFLGQLLFQHSAVHAYMVLLNAHRLPTSFDSAVVAGEQSTVTLAESGFVHTLAVPAVRIP